MEIFLHTEFFLCGPIYYITVTLEVTEPKLSQNVLDTHSHTNNDLFIYLFILGGGGEDFSPTSV